MSLLDYYKNEVEDKSDEDEDSGPREGISGEIFNLNKLAAELTKCDKSVESEDLIKKSMLKNPFLKESLKKEKVLKATVDVMYLKNYPAGSCVIREGEPGSNLYVCADGFLDVLQGNKKINTLQPGTVFGELALLYNQKRMATIVAKTPCSLWVLDRKDFHHIIMKDNIQRREENVKYLKSVPLLKNLDDSVLKKMSDLLTAKLFPKDTVIIKQGDEGRIFYIITSGKVVVTAKEADGTEKTLKILGKGDFFGEMAILNDDKRAATVTALAPAVECLLLDRIPFINLLGTMKELREEVKIRNRTVSEKVEKVSEYQDVDFKDLDVVGTLGVGAFGRVELVQHKKDKNLVFAMKCLKKVHVVEQQQKEHVFNEKEVMLECRNPFIARLYKTYRDSKYLYLLQEVCLGGDVFAMLHKKKRLDEHFVKFIAACVTEAFDYLHQNGMVYRDLKPENMLFDARGYVKLVDFGLAKKIGPTDKTWTFVGTPDYLAPEMILGKGHDRSVDYWTLGILIYELSVGRPPFKEKDPLKTCNSILKGIDRVAFPGTMNKTLQLLIKKLCRQEPTERLGYLKEGVAGIKEQKWFQGFDWESLQSGKMKAPYVPKIKGPTDLSNFEVTVKNEKIPPDDLTGWDAGFETI